MRVDLGIFLPPGASRPITHLALNAIASRPIIAIKSNNINRVFHFKGIFNFWQIYDFIGQNIYASKNAITICVKIF